MVTCSVPLSTTLNRSLIPLSEHQHFEMFIKHLRNCKKFTEYKKYYDSVWTRTSFASPNCVVLWLNLGLQQLSGVGFRLVGTLSNWGVGVSVNSKLHFQI